MKASAILLSGSLVVACGSTVSLEDLGCPCATGFVCCDKVCVAEGSCGGSKLIAFGAGDDGGGSGFGSGASGLPGFAPGETTANGGPTASFAYADSGAGGQSTNNVGSVGTTSASSSSTSRKADGGTASDSVYCSYPSDIGDAGAYVCSYNSECCVSFFGCGCSGTEHGSPATLAQTELECMSNGGSVVSVCPSSELVGCCATLGFQGVGRDIACSYGAPMQDELTCVANGGTWSTTAPG